GARRLPLVRPAAAVALGVWPLSSATAAESPSRMRTGAPGSTISISRAQFRFTDAGHTTRYGPSGSALCMATMAWRVLPRPMSSARIARRRRNRNRSEEHTSELQSRENLVCRLLLEKKKEKHIQKDVKLETLSKLVRCQQEMCM